MDLTDYFDFRISDKAKVEAAEKARDYLPEWLRDLMPADNTKAVQTSPTQPAATPIIKPDNTARNIIVGISIAAAVLLMMRK